MATLTTTATESVTINGKVYGNTITKTHASIEQVYQQVVTVGTSIQELFGFAASEKAGDVAIDKAKYIRFTNLGANFVTIHFSSDNASASVEDTASFIIEAGCSMIITDDQLGVGTAAASITPVDMGSISAIADTAAVTMEIFIGLTA